MAWVPRARRGGSRWFSGHKAQGVAWVLLHSSGLNACGVLGTALVPGIQRE